MNQDIESRVDDLERQVEDAHNKLISQEHRFIPVWLNFYKAWKSGVETKRKSALIALLTRVAPGKIIVIAAGGGFIGFVTILLMQKNNELIADQNYYFQQQIYQQKNADRAKQLIEISEKLHVEKEHKVGIEKGEPLYDHHVRTTALEQLVTLTVAPPVEPVRFQHQTIGNLIKTWMDENFRLDTGQPINTSQFEEEANQAEFRQEELENRFPLDLREAHLSKTSWRKIRSSLSAAKVYGARANFRSADMSNAALYGAHLSNADLTYVDLSDSDLRYATFYSSTLIKATLDGADLRKSKLTFADLSKADLIETNLSEATLNSSILYGADMSRSILINARLRGANLSNANLKGARLNGADLKDADLDNAEYNCKQLISAKNWEKAKNTVNCDERILVGKGHLPFYLQYGTPKKIEPETEPLL